MVPSVGALSNPELEAAIALEPDAPDAWLVYGDWLEARGSVRGELVQVQAALATTPDDPALREREGTLLTDHERAWLGDLADLHDVGFACTWRFGFLARAALHAADIDEAREWYRTLVALPAARLLRELQVQAWQRRPDDVLDVAALLDPAPSSILRRLAIETKDVNVVLGALPADVLPALEDLEIAAKTLELRQPPHVFAKLRSLVVTLSALSVTPDTLAALALPALERLELTMGAQPPFVDTLLARTPKLRSLTIHVPSWADEAVATLLKMDRLAKGLQKLDLAGSALTDTGVRMLLDHARVFEHLRLDVRYNRLAPATCAALTARFRDVQVDAQNKLPPWHSYGYDDLDE